MDTLDQATLNEIVSLLTPLLHSEAERRALLIDALGIGHPIFNQVDFDGATDPFVLNLVSRLVDYGELEPGRQALWVLLEVASGRVGADKRVRIRALQASIQLAQGESTSSDIVERPPTVDDTPYLFISYARSNIDFVRQLSADLRAAGIEIWIDQVGLKPGTTDWEQTLRDAIGRARGVLLIASRDSRQSPYVRDELAIADMEDKLVYPIWAEGDHWIDCIPMGRGYTQYIDARGTAYANTVPQILAALTGELAIEQPTPVLEPEAKQSLRNPYKGLRAFRFEDRADFFGRDVLIAELIEHLKPACSEPGNVRLLGVIGPSGSGKSSVVMAGFLPALQEGAINGSENWIYLDPIVPGNHPVENLTIALANSLPQRSLASIREDLDQKSKRGLHMLASQIVGTPQGFLLLFVDQFEELFTLTTNEDERQHFIDLLTTAATEPGGKAVVILTIRADFYDRPMQYAELGALLADYNEPVLPMSLADLQDAVERPAKQAGLSFDAQLVSEIVFAVRDQAGSLPLLQFTLDQLYERRDGRTLTLATYREMGGIHGALARHADRSFAALPSDDHRRLARTLFLRLIEPGMSEQDAARRRADMSEFELPDAQQTTMIQQVIEAFTSQARLLTTNEVGGKPTVEVSHEALLREWERLADWIHEAREDIRFQKSLSDDASDWARHDRSDDRLYRGTILAEARAWAERNTPSRLETDFIDTSVRYEEALAERERRRQRALNQARLGVAFAVALLALLGVLFFATQSRTQADAAATLANQATSVAEQRDRAEVAELDAQTQAALALAQADAATIAQGDALREANNAATAAANAIAQQAIAERRAGEIEALDFTEKAQQALLVGNEAVALLLALQANEVESPPALAQRVLADQIYPSSLVVDLPVTGFPLRAAVSPNREHVVVTGLFLDIENNRNAWEAPIKALTLNLTTGTVIGELIERENSQFIITGDAAFNPAYIDDPRVLIASTSQSVWRSGQLTYWDINSSDLIHEFVLDGVPLGVDISIDGTTAYVTYFRFPEPGGDISEFAGGLIVWDIDTGIEIRRYENTEGYVPTGIALGFDDNSLLVGYFDLGAVLASPMQPPLRSIIRVIDDDTGEVINELPSRPGILWDLDKSPTSNLVLASYLGGKSISSSDVFEVLRDSQSILWDIDAGREAQRFTEASAGIIGGEFSPQGNEIITGRIQLRDDDNERYRYNLSPILGDLVIWDARTGLQTGAFGSFVDIVPSGVFGKSDKSAFVGYYDPDNQFNPTARNLQIWHTGNSAEVQQFGGASPFFEQTAFATVNEHFVFFDDANTLSIWDIETNTILEKIWRDSVDNPIEDDLSAIALSQDQEMLLAGSSSGELILWDMSAHTTIRELSRHTDSIYDIAISPDAQVAVTGSEDQLTLVWELDTGDVLFNLPNEERKTHSIAFRPDGQVFATGAQDGVIAIWDATTGERIHQFQAHLETVTALQFSQNGQDILSSGVDGELVRWDAKTGDELQRFSGHNTVINQLQLSEDESTILSGDADGTVILWEITSGNVINRFVGHDAAIVAVAFGENSQSVLTAAEDRTVRQWDIETGREVRRLVSGGHTAPVKRNVISPDGQTAISASEDDSLIHWNITTGEPIRRLTGHVDIVNAVVYRRDTEAVSVSDDGSLIIWHLADGEIVRQLTLEELTPIKDVVLINDAQIAVVLTANEIVQWKLETGEQLSAFPHDLDVTRLSVSPDEQIAAVGALDNNIYLFDLATGGVTQQLSGHGAAVLDVEFSVDGQQLMSSASDSNIILWDVETGTEISRIVEHRDAITSIDLSPDGSQLISASFDETLILWDVASGERLRTFDGHNLPVWDVTFDSTGQFILSAGSDGRLILWENLSPAELVAWTRDNFILPEVSCGERERYNIEPRCVATLTPTFTLTPTPTVTPTITATLTPTRTPNVNFAATSIRLALPPTWTPTPEETEVEYTPLVARMGINRGEIDDQGIDIWIYAGTQGEVVEISVKADKPVNSAPMDEQRLLELFDPLLIVYAPDGRRLAESNDVSPAQLTDAHVRALVLPETGDYQFEVRAMGLRIGGTYRLTIEEGDYVGPTATAFPSATPTPSLTPTYTPTRDATELAQEYNLTVTALALTEIPFQTATAKSIQQTATAVALSATPTSRVPLQLTTAPSPTLDLTRTQHAPATLTAVVVSPTATWWWVRAGNTPTTTPSPRPTALGYHVSAMPTALSDIEVTQRGEIPIGATREASVGTDRIDIWTFFSNGDSFSVEVCAVEDGFDPRLGIYAQEGSLVDEQDDFDLLNGNTNARIDFRSPGRGHYIFAVSGFNQGGNYELSVLPLRGWEVEACAEYLPFQPTLAPDISQRRAVDQASVNVTATALAQLFQTATARAVALGRPTVDLTQIAATSTVDFTRTTATITPSATPTPTVTDTPDATILAVRKELAQATATATIARPATATAAPIQGDQSDSLQAVNLTATAIRATLQTATADVLTAVKLTQITATPTIPTTLTPTVITLTMTPTSTHAPDEAYQTATALAQPTANLTRTTVTPTPTITRTPPPRVSIDGLIFPVSAETAIVGVNRGNVPTGGDEVWRYVGIAGEVINLDVQADFPANVATESQQRQHNLLDPVVVIYAPDGTQLAQADDVIRGLLTDSVLHGVVLPTDGDYQIVVRGFADQTGGTYTLTIETGRTGAILPTLTPGGQPLATAVAPIVQVSPTVGPTVDVIVANPRQHLAPLYGLLDDLTAPRGAAGLLFTYWSDAQMSGGTGGCRTRPTRIPSNYVLPPEDAEASPELAAAVEQMNIGLEMLRDGQRLFIEACQENTLAQDARFGLTVVQAAHDAFRNAYDRLDVLRSSR